jgi:cystathionine beta-lyase
MSHTPTDLIHHPYNRRGFCGAAAGRLQGVHRHLSQRGGHAQRDWKDKSGYTYGLHGTPTTYLLEERIAARWKAASSACWCPAGWRPLPTWQPVALLKTGDEVLIPDNAYGPNKALAEGELAALGHHAPATTTHGPAGPGRAITPRTKLVWLEAPAR